MTAFFHSPFLSALGWALANSLWQMALLWLLFQLCFGINKRTTPRLTYLGALVFMLGGFIWFGITFAQQYASLSNISKYLANLPPVEDATVATTGTGAFSFGMLLSLGEKYLPYLSASYLLVLVMLFIRLINAYGYSQEVRTRGLIKIDYNWRVFVKDFANRIGIRREVAIYLSELIDVPATMGWLKPVILLPVATFTHLSPAQVEAVILHELSHIKRNDYLVNLLISVVETVLFFNPFCQLLASTIRKERENCCDDFVIQLRCDPGSYAAALLSLEKMRVSTQQQLAIAATGNKNQLLGRVKRILNVKSRSFNYGQKLTALLLTAFVLSSLAWLSPDEKSKPAKEPQQQAVADNIKTASPKSDLVKRDFAQQNMGRRKIVMPDLLKNKINLPTFERDLEKTDWQNKHIEPRFFSYNVPDSFAAFGNDLFSRGEFKMKSPDWNLDNAQPNANPLRQAWSEAYQDAQKAGARAHEYPRVYYNVPPGNYDLHAYYADSVLMKKYIQDQGAYFNQDFNVAMSQLQMKLGELHTESMNLSQDADLIKTIIELDHDAKDPDADFFMPPSNGEMKKRQKDSVSYRFNYQINTENRKLKSMNMDDLRSMKKLTEEQAGALQNKIQLLQEEGRAFVDLWNQKAKAAQNEQQRTNENVRNRKYNEFLQRVNPGNGEYQEKSDRERQMIERKVKGEIDAAQREVQKAMIHNRSASLEEYKKLMEKQQKEAIDLQKQLEDDRRRKKELESHEVVVNSDGAHVVANSNKEMILTTSSKTGVQQNMRLVFTISRDCVEPTRMKTAPMIFTIRGINKAGEVKPVEPKPAVKLHSIDL